ncbi:ATPase [Desulfobacter hydrogenophilus]|uniref:ATPase n=2 Tax=Desulfobacter hydrogenophilus TaxID=2291 RepID=A0A328F9S6_9BACT|nr:ABC-ATPase domain-containing protein [Desulfobacter hydrogenophilus]NDY74628.1 ABC-ATPase domain-containing protein [Desulfobacter hydrogenophilus]QBH15546.1 ATPase [Desulfobacter hydrogenophilus]RAL99832.1 ATPase [Desulfobacter hydrogenophilus]
MVTKDQLQRRITPLDGKDYGAFQSLIGTYDFEQFALIIDQIPKDPYAPPHTGIYRVQFSLADTVIEDDMIGSRIREIACRDFYARQFFYHSNKIAGKRRGTGYSGIITINEPGQTILDRSSVVINENILEIRCFVGLPASKRNVKAKLAVKMLLEELPEIVNMSLHRENTGRDQLLSHIHTAVDAEFLREKLSDLGLLAFIANGAILPRESGISDRTMTSDSIIPFKSPESLKTEIDLPYAGKTTGMGIPQGVTLLAGGGYHGKSTLLQVIEMGVYNHIAGDGREQCVSLIETVKVRSYSGRHVVKTDISPFIRNLPFQEDTSAFSTENASGSTSQAANIIEAIEMGAKVILMDEDTCATNFMIRDMYMQKLVKKSDEPITSYIDKVRQLYLENKTSTILALGGVGDYFEVADHVIQMINYLPEDVSAQAKDIMINHPTQRTKEDVEFPIQPKARIPVPESVDPMSGYGKWRLYTTEIDTLHFGRNKIDLTDLEQLIELSQTKAIGFSMLYARKYMNGKRTLKQVIDLVMADLEKNGLDILSDKISGYFAQFRSFELAFALNRMRSFTVNQI